MVNTRQTPQRPSEIPSAMNHTDVEDQAIETTQMAHQQPVGSQPSSSIALPDSAFAVPPPRHPSASTTRGIAERASSSGTAPISRSEFNELTEMVRAIQRQFSEILPPLLSASMSPHVTTVSTQAVQPSANRRAPAISAAIPSVLTGAFLTPAQMVQPPPTNNGPQGPAEPMQTWGAPPFISAEEPLSPFNPTYVSAGLPNAASIPGAYNSAPPPPQTYTTPQQQGGETQPLSVSDFPASHSLDYGSPLSLAVQLQPIPTKFKIPSLPTFGPTSDPAAHVINFNIHMDLQTRSEALKCRAFPATLDEQGKMWYASLAPLSIQSFKQLTDLFQARFSNQRQRPITPAQLMCLRQGPTESLRSFIDRFNAEARRVPKLLADVYMPALIQGINNKDLTRELGMRPPQLISELTDITSRLIAIEENDRWRQE